MKIKFLTRFSHISSFSFVVFGTAIIDLIKRIIKAIKNIFGK